MNKRKVIENIIGQIEEELALLVRASQNSFEDSMDEEIRAEGKFDTGGLELSMLAGSQAKLAAEAKENLSHYQTLEVKDFGAGDPILLSALVELESDGSRACYFVGPRGGGIEVEMDGKEITVITPQSPVGQQLVGKRQNDTIQLPSGKGTRAYKIVSVV